MNSRAPSKYDYTKLYDCRALLIRRDAEAEAEAKAEAEAEAEAESATSELVGGITANRIIAFWRKWKRRRKSAEAEAVKAALKSTASASLLIRMLGLYRSQPITILRSSAHVDKHCHNGITLHC